MTVGLMYSPVSNRVVVFAGSPLEAFKEFMNNQHLTKADFAIAINDDRIRYCEGCVADKLGLVADASFLFNTKKT